MKNKQHNNAIVRGFTLIELMIVVAIIGILAAVVIPMGTEYLSETRTTVAHLKCKASIKDEQVKRFNNPGYTYNLGHHGTPGKEEYTSEEKEDGTLVCTLNTTQ